MSLTTGIATEVFRRLIKIGFRKFKCPTCGQLLRLGKAHSERMRRFG